MTTRFPLEGLTVLVTGNLAGLGRPQAHAIITGLGGRPVASVSKATGLVVLGDGAGLSKMEKIRTHNLRVLSGADFEDLIEGRGEWGEQPGMPCDEWEKIHGDNEEEPDPIEAVAFSDRHLVGRVSLGVRRPDGRTVNEHRAWCITCGTKRHSADRADIDQPCPNDPVLQPVTVPA